MRLTDLHRRLLADVLEIGSGYPLVITGGYAVQAHGLADRLSQDLDVATEHPAPMPDIVTTLAEGLSARNWHVRVIGADPLSGRLVATDPVTGEECEVDVLKEAFWSPPQAGEWGPVLALDDVIGTKVRALADRGAVRDLIDVYGASRTRSVADLESLGIRHARDEFRLGDLRDRLVGTEWYEDGEFAAYGMGAAETAALRAWAQEWADDLSLRLHRDGDGDDD